MVGNQQSYRGAIVSLSLITILSPSTLIIEMWGIGRSYLFDAVSIHSTIAGFCWAIERKIYRIFSSNQMPDTLQVVFPYIHHLTMAVSLAGILSFIISALVLTNRVDSRRGFIAVVLIVIFLLLVVGLGNSRVEDLYTYRITPIPPTQIAALALLRRFGKKYEAEV